MASKTTNNPPVVAEDVQLTVMEAASYAGVTQQTIKNALRSPTFANIFTGQTGKREFPGTKYKPVDTISRSAIDAWNEARKLTSSGKKGFQRKASRNGRINQIKNEDWANVANAVAALGYELIPAFAGKPKKVKEPTDSSNNGASAPTDNPPVETQETPVDADLVEA